jgi:hypothetical protein
MSRITERVEEGRFEDKLSEDAVNIDISAVCVDSR